MNTGPLTNPPHEIYAYILNKIPNRSLRIKGAPKFHLMGVAVDSRTGKPLETCILPTKQRVMLALGVGNEEAQAHNTYRRATKNNYVLIWTEDPINEPALQRPADPVREGVKQALTAPPPKPAEPEAQEITNKAVKGFF